MKADRCNDCNCSSDEIAIAGGCPRRFDEKVLAPKERSVLDWTLDFLVGTVFGFLVVFAVVLFTALAVRMWMNHG